MKSRKTILLIEDNPCDVDLAKRAMAKTCTANELAEIPSLVLLDLKVHDHPSKRSRKSPESVNRNE